MAKAFAQAFCEQVGCPPEGYPRAVLKLCWYPQARLFHHLFPFYERWEDLELLEAAGRATNEEQLLELLRDYWDEVHLRGGWLAKHGKVRLSGTRLQKLFAQVMGPESSTQDSGGGGQSSH